MIDKTKPILLIDGSSLAFLHGNKENCKFTIKQHIQNLLNKYNTSYYIIVLEDSSSNFRNKVAVTQEYKGQRRTEKAKEAIKNYLPYLGKCFSLIKKYYRPVLYSNIENDDAISILANRLGNVVICANDIDMLKIEGRHHNLKTNKKEVVKYPGTISVDGKKVKATGLYNAYFKIMKGSPKENYKGIPGYGDVTVYNILKDLITEEEMQEACIHHFKKVFGEPEYESKLQEGFRLCWIIEENDSLITPTINDFNEFKNSINED